MDAALGMARHPRASRVPPEGECRLDVAAVMEGRTRTCGIAWRLTTTTGAEAVRTATRQHGRTLIDSELAAVRGGLKEALARGCRRLRVGVPDLAATRVLRGEDLPRYRRAEVTARGLRPLIDRFDAVRFDPEPQDDRDLLRAAGEALDVGLHRAADREEIRELVLERIAERAKEVQLERKDGRWIANQRYAVQLDPMRCDCPAWSARWARAPIAARRAQRLPCKHLVALALHEGLAVPSELAALARKAIA